MPEQVTLAWLLEEPEPARAWHASESPAITTNSPCVSTDDPVITELLALRADLVSLVSVLTAVADCMGRQLDVQQRNAVPEHIWRELDAMVRRRRMRGV